MTKAEIVKKVSKTVGQNQALVGLIIDEAVEEIKKSVIAGDDVTIRGFGKFFRKHRAEKTARNITKGTSIIVAEHDIPAFKAYDEFEDSVRNS